ncbi:MAG TPA: pyridoxal phosphate-dependent aminotransferase [Acidobacteriota bacterium]|jgi:hypothetical protein
MFSRRVAFDSPLNRLTTLLSEKMQRGVRIIDLTESNPTRAEIRYPDQLLASLHADRAMSYQPNPAGSREARRAVRSYYESKGLQVDLESIFLTASTSEAYSWIFKLLVNPGEIILTPRPSYPLFEHLALLESVSNVQYLLDSETRWRINSDDLESKLDKKTRGLVVVNPNNPTGTFITRSEYSELAGICRREQIALLADEVFADYALNPSPSAITSLGGRQDCLNFVLSGISKILCLPQMKLGWILVQGPQMEKEEACRRLEFIADAFLSVSAPVQHALAAWMEQRTQVQTQVIERLRRNLAFLENVTAQSTCHPLPVEGGWYVVLRVPATRSEEEWSVTLLEQENVLTHPGYFYDFAGEAFLVLSLLTPTDRFEEGIRRLITFVDRNASPT